ncbi:MAG TPA: hypothetical protein VFO31_10570 [Vicinamibacterales bacterium]|nr:hypothetical protein [Vicinamibacterales bacterium]
MASDRVDLAVEEYRALRATIRERGTMRALVTTITFVSWAGLSLAAAALFVVPPLALIPLVALAAGFEALFAIHVGVERIGRYIQRRFETGDGLPGWEHAAMKIGATRRANGGIDPLMTWPFVFATILNLMVVLIMQTDPGPSDGATLVTFDGPPPATFAFFAAVHAAFLVRVFAARRFARGQRERDLQLFS